MSQSLIDPIQDACIRAIDGRLFLTPAMFDAAVAYCEKHDQPLPEYILKQVLIPEGIRD